MAVKFKQMNVLIIKNITHEGPGTIEDYIKGNGIPYQIADYSRGETVKDTDEYTHLVIMGGPMAVYEMDKFPYLQTETVQIRGFARKGKPVLGICLGAQLIAHALGARVYPGGTKETGWYNVSISADGMKDPAFSSLSVNGESFAEVFQWHGDTFDLPNGAMRVSSSDLYQNQAFIYGSNIYALQFHIEVTPQIIREWFKDEKGTDVEKMLKETEEIYPEYLSRAEKFYKIFFT